MTGMLAGLGQLLEDRNLSSEELVQICLDRVAGENEKLHAFVDVFADQALAEARRLDEERRQGRLRGPLHGIPVAIKDLADLDGHVTGFGSRSYSSEPARGTAPFVERLKNAGLVVLGTTHMVEFAFGSWGTNHAVGTPWNPADRAVHRVPGGSSSGSAVAVAAKLVPAAIGSDTGGSIRIPASLCGIVGFKPTVGRVPTEGVAPLSPTFDTIGPLVNMAHDARLMFAALTGCAVPPPTKSPERMRVGIVEPALLEPLDPVVAGGFASLTEGVRDSVASCEAVRLPLALAEYQRLNGEIMAFEAYQALGQIVENDSTPLDPFVRERVRAGQAVDEALYHAALRKRQDAIRDFGPILDSYDVILLPTTPLRAVPIEAVDESVFPMSRFTRIGNYLDLCGLSLPLPSGEGGLPVGLQALAGTGRDADLLSFGEYIERTVVKRPAQAFVP